MCGRYKLVAEFDRFKRKFPLYSDISWDEFLKDGGYLMRPEVFPGTNILAINNQHKLENIWWTISETYGPKTIPTINAKAETIDEKRMFKSAFERDRVLIPATGLYEWQVQGDGKSKVKYEIWFDEEIFAFAGIARDCKIKDEVKRCGVIITTFPNDVFAEIHNVKQRQAVVIREKDYDTWLSPDTSVEQLKELMVPLPNNETHAQPTDGSVKQGGLF